MTKRLTLAEQRKLLHKMPTARKNAVKSHCEKCSMRGDGFMDILKSIGRVLGPVAKAIGPTVLKEFIGSFRER